MEKTWWSRRIGVDRSWKRVNKTSSTINHWLKHTRRWLESTLLDRHGTGYGSFHHKGTSRVPYTVVPGRTSGTFLGPLYLTITGHFFRTDVPQFSSIYLGEVKMGDMFDWTLRSLECRKVLARTFYFVSHRSLGFVPGRIITWDSKRERGRRDVIWGIKS